MSKTTTAKQREVNDDISEPNIVVWPEWSESEVLAEKWASKHAFEDPDGITPLPRSLRKFADGFKRACDIAGDSVQMVVVQPLGAMEDMFQTTTTCPIPNLHQPIISKAPTTQQTKQSHQKSEEPVAIESNQDPPRLPTATSDVPSIVENSRTPVGRHSL